MSVQNEYQGLDPPASKSTREKMDGRKCEIVCIKGQFRIPSGDELTMPDEQIAWETSAMLREMIEDSHHESMSQDFLLALLEDIDEDDIEKRQRILDVTRAIGNHIVVARSVMTPKELAYRTRAYIVELMLACFEDNRRLTRSSQPILFRHRDAITQLTVQFCAIEAHRNSLLAELQRLTGKIDYPVGTSADEPRQIDNKRKTQ
jgi:hypothetical protein